LVRAVEATAMARDRDRTSLSARVHDP